MISFHNLKHSLTLRKNLLTAITIFITFLLFSASSFAQVGVGGAPYSFNNQVASDVETIVMPEVDVQALIEEDKLEGKDVPYRFGYPMEVNLNTNNSGTWETLPNGDRLWRLKIYSENAITINLVYNDFFLPEGSRLYLYNGDHSEVIGAFTSFNNKMHGQFATGLLRGEETILEYYEPVNVVSSGIINISSVIHGYKNAFAKFSEIDGFGDSGACNNNVNCPEGVDWQNEKRSVAMILTSGNFRLCTGVMVNNVRQDLTPYFLTAKHCTDGGGSNTWIIMYNYESPNCSNIDGPLNYTVQGTIMRASNSASDFSLLELQEAPPDSYFVHYAGWTTVDQPTPTSTAIHHPSGDIKKISFEDDPTISDKYLGNSGVSNSHWKVADWDDGTTEPGSSGSPLFDENHRIVGQLHGGYAACGNDLADWYGKFQMSWDYGSTPSTRLKDWLDPDNTGVLYLDGWDPTIGDPDTVAPTTITDLATTDPTSNTITLTWTAPFDTSYGGVKAYDIRYALTPIMDTIDFANATQFPYGGIPDTAGATETAMVLGLDFNTTYYFAIRSRDTWNNWSNVSNSPGGTTLGAPDIAANPTSLHHTLEQNMTIVDSIVISNISGNPSTLNYSVTLDNNTFPESMLKLRVIPISSNEVENYPGNKTTAGRINYGQSIMGSGGPDNFGYEWIDSEEPNGPEYVWNDISTTGTVISNWVPTGSFDPRDEGVAGPFPLGFDFDFYGNPKTNIYVNTNGLILFSTISENIYSNDQIPDSDIPNEFIAPFWDDMDGSDGGDVYYQQVGNSFVIQFDNWPGYSNDGIHTFQVVINSSGKILVYYNSMTGNLDEATVGIENAAGNDGLQVAYNSTYVQDQLALKFSAEPDWLDAEYTEGTLYNGNSSAVELTFRSEDFPNGDYSMDMIIESNDPDDPELIVPISMTIEDEIPVELTSFNAEAIDDYVNLNWSTVSELNNSGFSIERKSTELNEWNEVAYIKGAGTTSEKVNYSYSDKKLKIGTYTYRLKQIDLDGSFECSKEIEIEVTAPKEFGLYQNYPNPFNPVTTIKFSVPVKTKLRIALYNNIGQLVKVITNNEYEEGYHEVQFNALNIASGVYFYRFESEDFVDTKKLTILK